ncbi:hypothetical protein H0H92_012563 [Tricholoma furcatifolium]|nr:hypothetical protein H0H92_012563 [Tricholoma furcatifolium]
MNLFQSRNFVAVPTQKRSAMPPPPVPSSHSQRGKRKSKRAYETASGEGARKKRKTKGKGKARDEDDEFSISSNESSEDDYNPVDTRQSNKRGANPLAEGSRGMVEHDGLLNEATPESINNGDDVDMLDQRGTRSRAPKITVDFEIDEEEEKPKPLLQLKYQGFDIFGHCLCVVIEPWPPVRSMTRAHSVSTVLNREPSIAPPRTVPAQEASTRGKTPLFLPDDWRDSATPAPNQRGPSVAPGSLLDPRFLEDSDDSDEDGGGMMLFSQVLNNAGDIRAGAANDDEDMDTDMFFGDADEVREL